ncbi:MAG: hypothetical protein WBD41_14210 [Rhodococcus sp. (in: high G+C Gram-positive bacteria)]
MSDAEQPNTFGPEQIAVLEHLTGLTRLASFSDEEISNLDLDFTEVEWYSAVVAVMERDGHTELPAMREHLKLAQQQEQRSGTHS